MIILATVDIDHKKVIFPKNKQTARGVTLNIIFKILSSITEKIARKAYVEFCDGKCHWADVLTEIKGFDAENRLVYKKNIAGVWKYNHTGHKLIASSKDVGVTTITTIYSDDGQRTIYESEDYDGSVQQETWFEYNAQNKLIKKKTVNMYNAHSSAWTFVDYEYNQNGVLEKTIETSEKDGKKDEGYIKTFYNEKGLEIRSDEYMVDPLNFFTYKFKYDNADNLISYSISSMGTSTITYQYDSQNNCIREKHDDGQEILYKTVVEKKGNLVIKKKYTYRCPEKKTGEA